MRRAGEPAGRFPRDHRDAVDGSFRRRLDGVEAEKRAGRHHDPRARLLRPVHEVHARQQCADAGRHEDPRPLDGGQGDLFENGGRRAFEHQVGAGREVRQRNDRRGRAELRLPRLCASRVPRRYGGERQAFDAGVDGGGYLPADRAEAAYAYPERHAAAAFPCLPRGPV